MTGLRDTSQSESLLAHIIEYVFFNALLLRHPLKIDNVQENCAMHPRASTDKAAMLPFP